MKAITALGNSLHLLVTARISPKLLQFGLWNMGDDVAATCADMQLVPSPLHWSSFALHIKIHSENVRSWEYFLESLTTTTHHHNHLCPSYTTGHKDGPSLLEEYFCGCFRSHECPGTRRCEIPNGIPCLICSSPPEPVCAPVIMQISAVFDLERCSHFYSPLWQKVGVNGRHALLRKV